MQAAPYLFELHSARCNSLAAAVTTRVATPTLRRRHMSHRAVLTCWCVAKAAVGVRADVDDRLRAA